MFDGHHSTWRRETPLETSRSVIKSALSAHGRLSAVVLAGVHSWGCSELERVVPRPMMPVVGQPLIGHSLIWLRDAGISNVGVCANSDTPVLRRWLGTGRDLRLQVDYYEDVMPRGPAGCMRDAMELDEAEHFVVVDGTVVPRLDLMDLVSFHLESGATMTVAAERSGGSDKRALQLTPVGIYVCARQLLKHIPERSYQDVKETLIPQMHSAGELVTTYMVETGSAPRVSSLESYMAVAKWELTRMVRREACPNDYLVRDQAWIHRSARVAASARFVGPVLVEAGGEVEGGAILVGPTTIGPGCRVGVGAIVCRSILWSGCLVERGARIDQCVLANGAVAAADTDIRNRVCLAPSRRQVFASEARSRWSPGFSLADDNLMPMGEDCRKPKTPAICAPMNRLDGMSPSIDRTKNSPSRWLSPIRMQSHGR